MEPMTFGERFRLARKRRRMSQRKVGQSLGLQDHALVSQWETDKALPTGAQMLALPSLLRVSGHFLLTGQGEATVGQIPAEVEGYREIMEIVCRVSGCSTTVGEEVRRKVDGPAEGTTDDDEEPPAREA